MTEALNDQDPPQEQQEERQPDPSDDLRRERDALQDRLLRTAAEFDNYRKRMDRERRDLAEYTAGEVISELLPIDGIDIVGPLPPGAQRVTVFSAGIASASRDVEAAKALIRFLASAAVAPVITRTGLEPIAVR